MNRTNNWKLEYLIYLVWNLQFDTINLLIWYQFRKIQIHLNWMFSIFTIHISFLLDACKNQRRKIHLSISSYWITIFVFIHDVQNYYEKHFRITWMYNTLLEFPLWCCLITRDECASLQLRICDVVKMRCKEQEIAHDWDGGIKELK